MNCHYPYYDKTCEDCGIRMDGLNSYQVFTAVPRRMEVFFAKEADPLDPGWEKKRKMVCRRCYCDALGLPFP